MLLSSLWWEWISFWLLVATCEYLVQHGKLLVFYNVNHEILRINNDASTTTSVTQFGRVPPELGANWFIPTAFWLKVAWNVQTRYLRTDSSRQWTVKVSATSRMQTTSWESSLMNLIDVLPDQQNTLKIYTDRRQKAPNNIFSGQYRVIFW